MPDNNLVISRTGDCHAVLAPLVGKRSRGVGTGHDAESCQLVQDHSLVFRLEVDVGCRGAQGQRTVCQQQEQDEPWNACEGMKLCPHMYGWPKIDSRGDD